MFSVGTLYLSYTIFNCVVTYLLLSEMLQIGAEVNMVDEKLRDELMAMKKKFNLMKVISITKKICIQKDTIKHTKLGVKIGKVFAFSEIEGTSALS